MLKIETKKIAGLLTVLALFLVLFQTSLAVDDYSSANFTVKAPVIDSGFSSSSSSNFGLGQSLTQTAIGKSTSTNFQLWSGFQYFFQVDANTLTATAGDGEVDLSWTVPDTFLGITVDHYEVGTGTISGSYTFENVGNVTSFTKTGLTNSTPYFFITKAISPAGTFLVFSNEATATPAGAGGGGGGINLNNLILSGQAYPNSTITVVRDSVLTSSFSASFSGSFQFGFNLPTGTYNFILFANDGNGLRSSNLSFNATVATSVLSRINDLLISPTITTDYSIIKKGENITISGYAAPSSSVTISVDSNSKHLTFQTTSDAQGRYSFILNTTSLPKENYTAKSFYVFNGLQSPYSPNINFAVGDRSILREGGVCQRSDLNCDGRVELIDFSILLYYWDSTEFSANPRVDIDGNGRVGLVDFSIMLYDWTG